MMILARLSKAWINSQVARQSLETVELRRFRLLILHQMRLIQIRLVRIHISAKANVVRKIGTMELVSIAGIMI